MLHIFRYLLQSHCELASHFFFYLQHKTVADLVAFLYLVNPLIYLFTPLDLGLKFQLDVRDVSPYFL